VPYSQGVALGYIVPAFQAEEGSVRIFLAGQKDDDKYTILSDNIHLTKPAYIAWGYFLYQGLNPPAAESAATLSADGKVGATKECKIESVKADKGTLSFIRADAICRSCRPRRCRRGSMCRSKAFHVSC